LHLKEERPISTRDWPNIQPFSVSGTVYYQSSGWPDIWLKNFDTKTVSGPLTPRTLPGQIESGRVYFPGNTIPYNICTAF